MMEWTKEHQRNALIRVCEIAIEWARSAEKDFSPAVLDIPSDGFATLLAFRDHLDTQTGLDTEGIDREVAIVRERAECWRPSKRITVGETVVIDGVPRVCVDTGPDATTSATLSAEEIAAIKARNAARTPENMILAIPMDGTLPLNVWEGTPCVGRTSEQNNTDWPGDERTIEVLALDGEPSLAANVVKARVRVRAQPYSVPPIDDSDPHAWNLRYMHEARVKRVGEVIEEDRVCVTANHAIFGALDDEPVEEREEYFVRVGDKWICCRLESWRERAIRLGASVDIPRLLATLDARDAELRKVTAQRDHLKRREQSIIDATDPADGGQYRTDIVSAIQRLRREREDARGKLLRIAALFDRWANGEDIPASDAMQAVGDIAGRDSASEDVARHFSEGDAS